MTPPRPPKAALFAVAGAAAVLVIGLIVIFGSGGKTKPPIPPPLTVDLNAQRRVEAEAAEARGDNDAAIKLFREIGDAVSVQRIENSIRRRAEDEAFAAIETEYKTGLKERFRELADAFLRNHPASRHARDVKAMLGPVPPPPSAETGFAKVYSSAEDKLFWTHTSDLARRVFFTADTILVSIPVAQSDPDEVEFLTLQDGNIEEYAFRFDFLPKLGTVGVCVGGRYRGDPALPGRTGWMPVSLGGLAPNAWHPVEVIVKEGKVTATSGGQALTSGPLAEKTSPFGHVGFFCRPGADFEIRNPRVAVHKRFDTTKLPNKTETAPPPPVVPVPVPVPVPPPPVKPDPGIVPAPALEAVRNHQYAKAAAALKGAEGEASRLLLERVEAAMAVLKETRETLKKDQSIDLIQRSGSKLQVKFIDTTETEIAVLYGGGRVTYRWAEIHPQFALNVLKNARKTTKLQRALFLLVESDPATALELMGQETVPGHREDAESAALAELDALLDAKKTAPAQALLKRLEAVKVAKLAERAIRLEVSGAKTDLDRAKIYVKHGKGAEAEALIAPLLKAAKATDVPGLAKILRDCVFARNPADLFNGRDLEGWTINPASQDIPQASGGVLTLACAGRFVQLQNDRIPLAQGLTFEARLKKIHEPGRGLGLWFHRINGQVYKQFTIRVATTDLQDVTGDEAKKLAGRAVAAGPEKWVRVDFFASAGQAYLFVDDAFLWRGDSPEESALGAGIGFLARDIDVDLRHIKVIEK